MGDLTREQVEEIMESPNPSIEQLTQVSRFVDQTRVNPPADNFVLDALADDLERFITKIRARAVGPREATTNMLKLVSSLKEAVDKL